MAERRGFAKESDSATRHSASDSRSYPEEALTLPYYHPTVTSMNDVRGLFLKYLETNGFYLLRKSFTKSSTLTVSVVFNRTVKHFTISEKEKGSYSVQGKLFASIQDLVNYYGKQEVPNKEEISGIYLKHPVLDSKRHHFFSNTSKRQVKETHSEARTRNSWRERNDGRWTDRMRNGQVITSQSFAVKAPARTPECLDDGYLQLNLISDATTHGFLSRPVSMCDDADEGRIRRSSEPESIFSGDRTLSNLHQPLSPGLQSRFHHEDRFHPRQQEEEAAQRTVVVAQSPTAAKTTHLHYSYARSPYTQLAPSLVQRLREIEGENAVKCECGVYHDDAELPRGWSFHRSTEPETYGRVLFTGPDGQLDWNLPLEVSLELSADQQDKIRDLICRALPRPCTHFFDASGSGLRSAANVVVD